MGKKKDQGRWQPPSPVPTAHVETAAQLTTSRDRLNSRAFTPIRHHFSAEVTAGRGSVAAVLPNISCIRRGHSVAQIPSFSEIHPRFQHPLRLKRLFFNRIIYSSPCRGRKKAEVAALSAVSVSSPISSTYRDPFLDALTPRCTVSHTQPFPYGKHPVFCSSISGGSVRVATPPSFPATHGEDAISAPEGETAASPSARLPPCRVTGGCYPYALSAIRLGRVRIWRQIFSGRTCRHPQRRADRCPHDPTKHPPLHMYED